MTQVNSLETVLHRAFENVSLTPVAQNTPFSMAKPANSQDGRLTVDSLGNKSIFRTSSK